MNVTGDMPDYIRLYRGSAAVRKPFGSEFGYFPGTAGSEGE